MKFYNRDNIEHVGNLSQFFTDVVYATEAPAGYHFLSIKSVKADGAPQSVQLKARPTLYLYAKPTEEVLEHAKLSCSEGRVGAFEVIGGGWEKDRGQYLFKCNSANHIGGGWLGLVDLDIEVQS